jgi:hypothetical protein
VYPTAGYLNLMQDILINADLWDKEPRIFTANYAFEGIQGVVNGNIESYATAAGEDASKLSEPPASVTGAGRAARRAPPAPHPPPLLPTQAGPG